MIIYSLLVWFFINLATSLIAPLIIPYLGFFSYGFYMYPYNMPDSIRALTNFDGIFYIKIATEGYYYTEQAYFPLYPLLIRFVNLFINNPIISGVLISYAAFLTGIAIFNRYLKLLVKPPLEKRIILFLLAYPTSYYFGVMYTESLFFMLFIASLFFFKKRSYVISFIAAYLTGLTRVVGVFLVIPLALLLFEKIYKEKSFSLKIILSRYWKFIIVILAPALGLFTYCFYLWSTSGDPLLFFHVQEEFGANRSSHLITPPQVLYRYLKIFLTADISFQYFVAISELSFYLFALTVLGFDLKKIIQKRTKQINFDRLGLNLFSFINILLPSLTGTLTAMPRYTLLSLSIFFLLAELKSSALRYFLIVLFCVLHIVLYSLFIQGYYVT